jgi:hypothetical protein
MHEFNVGVVFGSLGTYAASKAVLVRMGAMRVIRMPRALEQATIQDKTKKFMFKSRKNTSAEAELRKLAAGGKGHQLLKIRIPRSVHQ